MSTKTGPNPFSMAAKNKKDDISDDLDLEKSPTANLSSFEWMKLKQKKKQIIQEKENVH